MLYYLQRLATDKLGPATNLGGNTLRAGQLLAHALRKEDSGLKQHVSINVYSVFRGEAEHT